MTQVEKVNYVKNEATNMVQIEGVMNQVTHDFLNHYAKYKEKAPSDITKQKNWVSRALAEYKKEILMCKIEIFNAIPIRFHITLMHREMAKKFSLVNA